MIFPRMQWPNSLSANLIHRLSQRNSLILPLFLLSFTLLFQHALFAQSFYREKSPKTWHYQLGVGTGTFFSAPRPSYDAVRDTWQPTLQLGIGKRFTEHFLLQANAAFQPFASHELLLDEEGIQIGREPMVHGQSYTAEIVPTLSLFPAYHHISRKRIDLHLGIGLGYLFTYRTEDITIGDTTYRFNAIKQGFYVPIKSTLWFRLSAKQDIGVEGNFLYTFFDPNREGLSRNRQNDHFGRLSFMYRRFLR
ncbi:hypothetical protein A3SI_05152 [Nitritalea halalkaliphila LW7]|uniref:Outer membrane protein beta-barrel domain-containing protein n=2 Tax=Nitritalea TaxID=1187887 RepID=I5C865_9BACT|nr:hypothetical protein A3SI_05152 [Nitritalea halalkaliphila LW7]